MNTNKKTTKRKAASIPDGISFKRTARGITVRIAENGRVLASMSGYNNTQNMQKGLRALNRVLNDNFPWPKETGTKYVVIDLTPKKK